MHCQPLFTPSRTASALLMIGLSAAAATAQTAFELSAAMQAGNQPESISSGDLDGDGDHDLALANFGDHTVSVLLNDGSGVFTVSVSQPVGFRPPLLGVIETEDLGFELR